MNAYINTTKFGLLLIIGIVLTIAYINTNSRIDLTPIPKNESYLSKDNSGNGLNKGDIDYMNAKMDGWQSNHTLEGILPHVDTIVIATITAIAEAKWNTQDGRRPANWSFGKFHQSRIYTPYQFRVEQTLRGTLQPGMDSSFAVVGGTVGLDTLDADDAMDIYGDIQSGDRAILFLQTTSGTMQFASPYAYGDVFRIEGSELLVGCSSLGSDDCRVKHDLSVVLAEIQS